MYYSKGYIPQYGGGYHNYSTSRDFQSPYERKQIKEPVTDTEASYSMPLAMSYVPWQTWGNLYDDKDALKAGTIFKELNLKFCG